MSTDEKKPEGPKTIQYELPTGAIALLEEIMPTPTWYKEDPKQARLICSASDAINALPDTPERPRPEKDETPDAYKQRVDAWAEPSLMFSWTDKQKDAAKKCVAYYLKQGAFTINRNTVALLHLLGLDDE